MGVILERLVSTFGILLFRFEVIEQAIDRPTDFGRNFEKYFGRFLFDVFKATRNEDLRFHFAQ